jgi:hypothetical protein
VQLNAPAPYDLDDVDLQQYKNLALPWTDWGAVAGQCAHLARILMDSAA